MPKLSVLEYLKSEAPKAELYQIRLSKNELLFTYEENPKLIEKLEHNKILQEFIPASDVEEEKDDNASIYCLALPKKGHLSNLEQKELVSPKDEINQTINVLQSLCAMRGKNLNPKHLTYILQEVTGQTVDIENELADPDLTDEQRKEITLMKSEYDNYQKIPEEQRLAIAAKLGQPESKDTLMALLNLNSEDRMSKLIATVTKFFELRFPALKLTSNEVACFHQDVLSKINLFISYEQSQWDTRTVPKQLKQYIRLKDD